MRYGKGNSSARRKSAMRATRDSDLHSGGEDLNIYNNSASKNKYMPTRVSDSSLKKIGLYQVMPLPPTNTFARAQNSVFTRNSVGRASQMNQNLVPTVGHRGNGFKTSSPRANQEEVVETPQVH